MNKKKRIALGVLFVILLIASNLLGGIIAFDKGFKAGLYLEGLSVSPTILMLKQLKEGKTEWPIKMLETKLDWQIYNMDNYKTDNDSIYNILNFQSAWNLRRLTSSSMNEAIKYRRETPSSFDDVAFQKKINEILTKYENVNAK